MPADVAQCGAAGARDRVGRAELRRVLGLDRAVALRWIDVALDRGLLRLDSSYVVRDGQRRLKGTKTDDERWPSVDALTVEILEALRTARAVTLEPAGLALPVDAFVFSPDPLGGGAWHPDHFTHAYRALADELGVVEPLKNLRHFNATQLLAAGVDLRATAGRLGHSDGGATTLRHYGSWTRPPDQRAAELLANDLTVAEQLRLAITAGRLAPGDLLPTVPGLAGHCGLARSTVSRALGLLAEQAVIVRSGTRWATASDTGEAATS